MSDKKFRFNYKKGAHMLNLKVLVVVISLAFAGSVFAQSAQQKLEELTAKANAPVQITNANIVIKGKSNLSGKTGSTITAANGTKWNVDNITLTIDKKPATKADLSGSSVTNCVLTGVRAGAVGTTGSTGIASALQCTSG